MEIIFGALGIDGRPALRSDLERMAAEAIALIGGAAEIREEGRFSFGAVRRAEGSRIGALAELASDQASGRAVAALLRPSRTDDRSDPAAGPDGILSAWNRGGPGACAELRGDFSFALWDEGARALTCARDPLGQAPLFHLNIGGVFYFASHLNCLRKLPSYSPLLDESALAARLGILPQDGERTLFRGIRRFRAGCAVEVGPTGLRAVPYWTPPGQGILQGESDEELAERCRVLFTASVEDCIVPDAATGVLLSGGLDSAAIACVAAECAHSPLIAASSLLPPDHPGPERDEREFVAHVQAQIPDLKLLPVYSREGHPFDDLEEYFELHGEPPNPFHHVDTALRESLAGAGVKVALSGFLGDALCSGNGRHAVAELLRACRIRSAAGTWAALASAGQSGPRDLLLRQIPFGFLPGLYCALRFRHSLFLANRSNWDHTAASAQLIADTAPRPEKCRTAPDLVRGAASFGSPYVERETLSYSRDGIEARFPCWERGLAELCIAMPPEQFALAGERRSLFRRAMTGILPDPIRNRPGKHPFAPDFHTRLAERREQVEREIRDLENSPSEDRFVRERVDPEKVLAAFARVRPTPGEVGWDSRSGQVLAKGYIAIRFLRWFSRL